MGARLLASFAVFGFGLVGCGGSSGSEDDGGTADTPADTIGFDTPDDTIVYDAPPSSCEETGDSHFFVFSSITVDSNTDMTIAPGFNLDGRVSEDTDELGCSQPDYTNPPPDSEEGVDNQLGPILQLLESFIDVQQELDDGIAAGTLTILLDVSNVDDLVNDDCVTVSVLLGKNAGATCSDEVTCEGGWTCTSGTCTPTLEEGQIAPGQTFNVDAAVEARVATARIINGRLRIPSADLAFAFPVSGGTLDLDIIDTELRVGIDADGLTAGNLGGSLEVESLITAVLALGGLPEDIVRSVFTGQADLNPPECDFLSVGLEFAGTTAVKGDAI